MTVTNSNGNAAEISVAITGQTGIVRVVGRGSFKVSPEVKWFGAEATKRGIHQLIFDMSDCIGMDSTFMGVMAGLANNLKQECNGKVLVVNLSERTLGLLNTLGLDQLMEVSLCSELDPEIQTILGCCCLVDPSTEDLSDQELAKTVLESHETLVELVPENLPKFQNVLTFLKEDMKRKAEAEDGVS